MCKLKVQLKSHIHTLENEKKCEGMNPHIPKWTLTLKIGIPMESWESNLKGQNSFIWVFPYTIEKNLRRRFFKWVHMTHLSTYKISYGWKKGWESKYQIDSRPLKVWNRPKLHACKWRATYHWKVLNKGYKYFSNLVSIEGLHTLEEKPHF
jgi:hypothetical protein